MKYKQHRKLITLTCDCCGCSYEKPLSEYNRNQKFGRHSTCINYMKNTMSDSDTRLVCKYIAEHFCSEGTISSPCIAA